MPGPAPRPTALRVLEGNPSKRPLPAREPQPTGKIGRPPAHLNRAARAEWRRIVREMEACRVLTAADRAALAAYCVAYSRWVAAETALAAAADADPDTGGLVVKTSNGNVVQNPLVGTANKAMETMMRAAQEFGFTPSSRSRVHVEAPQRSGNAFERRGIQRRQ